MREFWLLVWAVILQEMSLCSSVFVEKASSMCLLDLKYLYMPGLHVAYCSVSGIGIMLNIFVQESSSSNCPEGICRVINPNDCILTCAFRYVLLWLFKTLLSQCVPNVCRRQGSIAWQIPEYNVSSYWARGLESWGGSQRHRERQITKDVPFGYEMGRVFMVIVG